LGDQRWRDLLDNHDHLARQIITSAFMSIAVNGAIVLVTNLTAGQRATVLQLPASPIEEKPQASQPAARYETANV
jgi:hypothetical protein